MKAKTRTYYGGYRLKCKTDGDKLLTFYIDNTTKKDADNALREAVEEKAAKLHEGHDYEIISTSVTSVLKKFQKWCDTSDIAKEK